MSQHSVRAYPHIKSVNGLLAMHQTLDAAAEGGCQADMLPVTHDKRLFMHFHRSPQAWQQMACPPQRLKVAVRHGSRVHEGAAHHDGVVQMEVYNAGHL